MRTILLLLLFTPVFRLAAQDTPPKSVAEPSGNVFIFCDPMPEFPGGEQAMLKFLSANIQYPDSARAHDEFGRVVVRFCVMQDGHVDSVQIVRGVSLDLNREAKRVISIMPASRPGMVSGKPVITKMVIPIEFKMQ